MKYTFSVMEMWCTKCSARHLVLHIKGMGLDQRGNNHLTQCAVFCAATVLTYCHTKSHCGYHAPPLQRVEIFFNLVFDRIVSDDTRVFPQPEAPSLNK